MRLMSQHYRIVLVVGHDCQSAMVDFLPRDGDMMFLAGLGAHRVTGVHWFTNGTDENGVTHYYPRVWLDPVKP